MRMICFASVLLLVVSACAPEAETAASFTGALLDTDQADTDQAELLWAQCEPVHLNEAETDFALRLLDREVAFAASLNDKLNTAPHKVLDQDLPPELQRAYATYLSFYGAVAEAKKAAFLAGRYRHTAYENVRQGYLLHSGRDGGDDYALVWGEYLKPRGDMRRVLVLRLDKSIHPHEYSMLEFVARERADPDYQAAALAHVRRMRQNQGVRSK